HLHRHQENDSRERETLDGNAKRDDHYEGVFWVTVEDRSRRLATKNLAPGISVYGETLVRDGEVEYRTWDVSIVLSLPNGACESLSTHYASIVATFTQFCRTHVNQKNISR